MLWVAVVPVVAYLLVVVGFYYYWLALVIAFLRVAMVPNNPLRVCSPTLSCWPRRPAIFSVRSRALLATDGGKVAGGSGWTTSAKEWGLWPG
jgi:hypothetical protein